MCRDTTEITLGFPTLTFVYSGEPQIGALRQLLEQHNYSLFYEYIGRVQQPGGGLPASKAYVLFVAPCDDYDDAALAKYRPDNVMLSRMLDARSLFRVQ